MIIDGVKIAEEREQKLKARVKPGTKLAILVFQGDRAGQVYSRLKQEVGKRLGIEVITSSDPAMISKWNNDVSIQGIMIQRPGYRGKGFEEQWVKLVNQIDLKKDVDGLRENSFFIQATVRAVEEILETVPFRNGTKKIVVVGRGMVGKKLAARLKGIGISSKDEKLTEKTREADILISATGREGLIKTEMVKPGATVIDVGWPKGDVDFEAVKNVAGAITPVPGGVGPVTVICLLENLVNSHYTN